MDVSHNLEMTSCVVNQLKNDSYCLGLYASCASNVPSEVGVRVLEDIRLTNLVGSILCSIRYGKKRQLVWFDLISRPF